MSKVVYICSAGHSGSTLLDLLIGSHSQVTSLGEISQLPKNLALNTTCTCGKSVRKCEVWSVVVRRLGASLGVSIEDNPYALNLGYYNARVVVDHSHQNSKFKIKREMVLGLWYSHLRFGLPVPEMLISTVKDGARNSFLMYDEVTEILGTDYVVDSSKNYLKAISLYKHKPDDVKIILLARDGRGVFYSGRKRKFSRKESLNSWKNYYKRALPLLDLHVSRGDILNVHYEDLASSPERILNEICKFIGLVYERNMFNPFTKLRHITNGNDMRFEGLDIKPDYSWRNEMSVEDMKYFKNKAGLLNVKIGYKDC